MEELVAEQEVIGKQGLMRTVYQFENNKVVNCINTMLFYDDNFAKITHKAFINPAIAPNHKNLKFDGKILEYEWSDAIFKQKGKDESKETITQFLKESGWKIKK